MGATNRVAGLGALLSLLMAGPGLAFAVDPFERVELPGGGIDVIETLELAARWPWDLVDTADLRDPSCDGVIASRSNRGLEDGLQVAIGIGVPEMLGEALEMTSPEDIASLEGALIRGAEAWSSAVLFVEVDPGGVQNFTQSALGYCGQEVDILADSVGVIWNVLPGPKLAFAGFEGVEDAGRRLTNGSVVPGTAILYGDVLLNPDRIAARRSELALSDADLLIALELLVTHEVGHTLGLWHPDQAAAGELESLDGTIQWVAPWNLDTDDDPTNLPAIDGRDPFSAGWMVSAASDDSAVMHSFLIALDETGLRNDDVAGRDVLYPLPEPASALMLAVGALVLGASRTRRPRASMDHAL